jgi:hypothetical protein
MANILGLTPAAIAVRRGRKPRTDVDRMRSIAWAHAVLDLSGVSTVDSLADDLSATQRGSDHCVLAKKDLDRYFKGENSPCTRLAPFERLFPGSREVFEQGPCGVPLWAALEGESPAPHFIDVVNADLLPGGDLPLVCRVNLRPSQVADWFCDEVAGTQSNKRDTPVDAIALSSAIFLDRWLQHLSLPTTFGRLALIRLLLARQGVQRWLCQFGLQGHMSRWFERHALDRGYSIELAEIEPQGSEFDVSLAERTSQRAGASDPREVAEVGRAVAFAASCAGRGDLARHVRFNSRATSTSLVGPACVGRLAPGEDSVDDQLTDAVSAIAHELRIAGNSDLAMRIIFHVQGLSASSVGAAVELANQVLGPQVRIPPEHLH